MLTFTALANVEPNDKINFDGTTYDLLNRLMQGYFKKHAGQVSILKERPRYLTRGYIATFAFKDDVLIVHDLTALLHKKARTVLQSILHCEISTKRAIWLWIGIRDIW